jgi:hypothetical protein
MTQTRPHRLAFDPIPYRTAMAPAFEHYDTPNIRVFEL